MRDKEKQKLAQHNSYKRNKESIINRNAKRRKERKLWFYNFLSKQKCLACGENSPECLDLHHIDPSEKDDSVSQLIAEFRSIQRVITEIEKCVVLCANCHRKHHAGTLNIIFTDKDKIKFIDEWSRRWDSNP